MTRVIAQQWISLDGLAGGPGGEADLFAAVGPDADERSQRHNLALVPACDHVLLGRRTYESFVGYWPTATDAVADVVNAGPKVVASRSLDHAPWGGHAPADVVRDGVDHVRRHRAAGGGDVLVWGSLDLTAALLAADELDELDLFVVPVLLGTGTPVLPGPLSTTQLVSEDWGSLTHLRLAVRRRA